MSLTLRVLLFPGDKITINEYGELSVDPEKHIGVVDPFLKEPVDKGETFWLFN
jgi:hypothetical protein